MRRSVRKGRPYGTDDWVSQMVAQWTLQATVRGDRNGVRNDFRRRGNGGDGPESMEK